MGGEVIGMKLYTYIMLSTASLRFDQRTEVAQTLPVSALKGMRDELSTLYISLLYVIEECSALQQSR